MRNVSDILEEGARTYEKKNDDYGSSWYSIGEILHKMAGNEPVTLSSPEDWVRVGLYTRRLDKLFRSFNGEFRTDELNFESVADAHEDESVYAAMAAAIAGEEIRAEGEDNTEGEEGGMTDSERKEALDLESPDGRGYVTVKEHGGIEWNLDTGNGSQ